MPCIYRMNHALEAVSTATASSMSSVTTQQWGPVGITGIHLQIIGLSIETISDAQKQSFKNAPNNVNRERWCHVGLWKVCSHPNYLGECLFWLGTYLGGIGGQQHWHQYFISGIGLAGILAVVRGLYLALLRKQMLHYGHEEEFSHFSERVGFFGPKLFFRTSESLRRSSSIRRSGVQIGVSGIEEDLRRKSSQLDSGDDLDVSLSSQVQTTADVATATTSSTLEDRMNRMYVEQTLSAQQQHHLQQQQQHRSPTPPPALDEKGSSDDEGPNSFPFTDTEAHK
mmetsp:Transcript_8830/g.8961  ORF Transcript_8830/g.8961 Transcript_8830/m.8961 type:complete len:283 (-) Transcript_8830:85-933(-)